MPRIVFPTPSMSFVNWANSLYTDMDYYEIPPITSENNWWAWAENVVLVNKIEYAVPFPTKSKYKNVEDWRTWAKEFADGVYNLRPK
jgi:hypothetical protein